MKFLEIFEIFGACGNLIYCSCEADWQKFHLFDPWHTGCSNLIYICNHENNVHSRLSPQWLCGDSFTWAHDVWLYIYIYIYIADTFQDSRHFLSMSYNNSNTQNAQRNWNGKIIWFHPPYSQNVKMLIKLVGKHFHKNNKYHKISNLITLKLSYCCITNVGNIIKQHNSKVLSKTNDSNNYKCNCRSKSFNGELNGHVSVSLNVKYIKLIYNIQQQLCLLWNFWRGVQNTV